MERPSTHKYNTISRTKRVKHVVTFKNAPNFFLTEPPEKIKFTEAQTNMLTQSPKKIHPQWNQWKTTSTVKLKKFI